MAIPLDTSPNHGSEKRVDEVVGSAFRGGPYITQSGRAERYFEPTNMVSQRLMGRQALGLGGRCLIVQEWLVAS